MKKSLVRNEFAIVMVLVMMLSFAACDKEPTNTDNGTNNSGQSSKNNPSSGDSKWAVDICGRSISLPCSLADLLGEDVRLDDADKNKVIEAVNQTFTMIPAVCGDDAGVVYLKIKTGSDAGKKEANATVVAITNNDSAHDDVFKVKDNHAIGSNVSDVIATYGEGYVIDSAPSSDDLSKGFVMLHYGEDEGMLLWFRDGKLIYIESFVGDK